MEYWILFIFGSIILFATYFFNHKDFLSPSFILCFGYDLSFLIALINKDSWQEEISFFTVIVFLSGIIAYVFIDTISNRVLFKVEEIRRKDVKLDFIRINTIIWLLFCAISLIIVIFTIREVIRIGLLNTSIGNNVIQNYKVNFFDEDLEGNGFNQILIQLLKIPKGLAYIGIMVFSNNYFSFKGNKRKMQKFWKLSIYLIPAVLYCVERGIMGERYTIIGFVFSFVVAFCFFSRLAGRERKKNHFRNVLLIAVGIVAAFILFYQVRTLVGRSSEYNFTEYIGFYVGAEVPMLNKYILSDSFDGSSSILKGIYSILNKFGFGIETTKGVWEYRYSNSGMMLGNAYSALRAYYHDLGLFGVVLMNALYAIVFRGLYNFLRKRFAGSEKPYLIMLLYLYYVWIILFQFFTDYGITKLNAGTITEILVMLVLYKAITIVVPKKTRSRFLARTTSLEEKNF